MNVYQCFFTRYVSEVADLLVIEARDDARVLILADYHMADYPIYASVEIFDGERRVAQFERAEGQQARRRLR